MQETLPTLPYFTPQDFNMLRIFETIAKSVDANCAMFDKQSYNLLYITESLANITGYSTSELPQNINDLIRLCIPEKEDVEVLTDAINNSYQSIAEIIQNKSAFSVVINSNLQIRTKTNLLVYVTCSLHPLTLDENGTPKLYLVHFKQRRQRRSLKTSIFFFEQEKKYIYIPQRHKFTPYHNILLKTEEVEILRFATNGYNEIKMAKLLNKNVTYIKYYKKRIFNKLNASNINEAVYIAIQAGLL